MFGQRCHTLTGREIRQRSQTVLLMVSIRTQAGGNAERKAISQDHRSTSLAGASIFVGTVWLIISVVVAEALTPDYSVSKETISGLGTPFFSLTCTAIPACLAPIQPASIIFVSSLFILGSLLLFSAHLLRRTLNHGKFVLALYVLAVAWLLVGASYIPIYAGFSSDVVLTAAVGVHASGAFPLFVLTPLAAIYTSRLTKAPLSYLSIILGAVSLAALLGTVIVQFFSANYFGLGVGGMERLVMYPFLLWMVGFGAYLTGTAEEFGK